MAYNTTDSTDFNLDLTDVVEEAFERAGGEVRSGYDLRAARRSLNLMLIEWVNRGLNFWTIDSSTIPMVSGTATYDLPLDTVDLLDFVIRTGTGTAQTDIYINRISSSQYANIPNKNSPGKPLQVWVERRTGANNSAGVAQPPRINVWPVPDVSSTYTFVYWRMRRIQDAGNGVNGQDVPFRFLPPLVAGLAYYIALKTPGAEQRAVALKAVYEEQYRLAAEEDRDRSTLRLVPAYPGIM